MAQIPGTTIPYAAPMSRLRNPALPALPSFLGGMGAGQIPSLRGLNLANMPGVMSGYRPPASAPTIATTGGYQAPAAAPTIQTTGGYTAPPQYAAAPMAAAPPAIPPLTDAMFTASAKAMRQKLANLPSIQALYGGRPPAMFQAPGSPFNMPELGLSNIPLPWQAAALFGRSSPYNQQQYLDLWQAGSIPPLYALASMMSATPGYRANPVQAPMRWF